MYVHNAGRYDKTGPTNTQLISRLLYSCVFGNTYHLSKDGARRERGGDGNCGVTTFITCMLYMSALLVE